MIVNPGRFVVSLFVMVLLDGSIAQGQVVTFEGDILPEDAGWERVVYTEISRSLADGYFIHFVDETNEIDSYRRPVVDFAGVAAFFVEWRAESDAPASILDTFGTPAVLSAAGRTSAIYHFTFTESKVQVWRGNFFPILSVDIELGLPHTYRVEVCGPPKCVEDRYVWYIDGILGDSGIGRAPYPTKDSFLIWGTRRQGFDSYTRWDYVRVGIVPRDASGDFDISGRLDLFDFYFFHECLTNDRIGINGGPGNDAGPGCRWADFNSDHAVDLTDFAAFQNLFDGHH